ncbi:MAG: hypothetical protein ACREBS_01000 [Nitrososphaerales archaeon]
MNNHIFEKRNVALLTIAALILSIVLAFTTFKFYALFPAPIVWIASAIYYFHYRKQSNAGHRKNRTATTLGRVLIAVLLISLFIAIPIFTLHTAAIKGNVPLSLESPPDWPSTIMCYASAIGGAYIIGLACGPFDFICGTVFFYGMSYAMGC